MGIWISRLFRRMAGTAYCVVPGKKEQAKPTKAFIIVILLAVLATVGLSVAGMPLATSIQVVMAVIAGIQAVRQLTAWTAAVEPGTAR
ncbi:hypothetical protein PL81_39530 [Streptomyces sp. RSD-27]|nr:hypothetical protein PL81_39530 [Streptomyces sp. RSD-27]